MEGSIALKKLESRKDGWRRIYRQTTPSFPHPAGHIPRPFPTPTYFLLRQSLNRKPPSRRPCVRFNIRSHHHHHHIIISVIGPIAIPGLTRNEILTSGGVFPPPVGFQEIFPDYRVSRVQCAAVIPIEGWWCRAQTLRTYT